MGRRHPGGPPSARWSDRGGQPHAYPCFRRARKQFRREASHRPGGGCPCGPWRSSVAVVTAVVAPAAATLSPSAAGAIGPAPGGQRARPVGVGGQPDVQHGGARHGARSGVHDGADDPGHAPWPLRRGVSARLTATATDLYVVNAGNPATLTSTPWPARRSPASPCRPDSTRRRDLPARRRLRRGTSTSRRTTRRRSTSSRRPAPCCGRSTRPVTTRPTCSWRAPGRPPQLVASFVQGSVERRPRRGHRGHRSTPSPSSRPSAATSPPNRRGTSWPRTTATSRRSARRRGALHLRLVGYRRHRHPHRWPVRVLLHRAGRPGPRRHHLHGRPARDGRGHVAHRPPRRARRRSAVPSPSAAGGCSWSGNSFYFASGPPFNGGERCRVDLLAGVPPGLPRRPGRRPDALGWGAGLSTPATGEYFAPGVTPEVDADFDPWWVADSPAAVAGVLVREPDHDERGDRARRHHDRPSDHGGRPWRRCRWPSRPRTRCPDPTRSRPRWRTTPTDPPTVLGTTCLPYTVGAGSDSLDLGTLPAGSEAGAPVTCGACRSARSWA